LRCISLLTQVRSWSLRSRCRGFLVGSLGSVWDSQDRRDGRFGRRGGRRGKAGLRFVCHSAKCFAVSTRVAMENSQGLVFCLHNSSRGTYLMNLNSWRPWKRVIASNDPVHSESMITTSWPCWRRSSTKWPPRKPAPLIDFSLDFHLE
jgi:hypothetical protein